MPASAAEGDEAVLHPLLSDDARELIAAHPDLSEEELWRSIWVFDEAIKANDAFVERTGATWQDDHGVVGDADASDSTDVVRPVLPTMDAQVEAWLVEAGTTMADVAIVLDRSSWDDTVSVPYQQGLAMLRGDVSLQIDLARVRTEVIETRRSLGEEAMADFLHTLEALGADVIATSPLSGTVRARVPKDALSQVVVHEQVSSLASDMSGGTPDIGGGIGVAIRSDGVVVADWLQTNPLYNHGYDGDPLEFIGLAEINGDQLHNEHDSFYTGSGFQRVFNCQGTGPTCTHVSLSIGTGHATKGASVLVSDLTLGQDAAITDPVERIERSGIARGAKLLGLDDDRPRMIDVLSTNASVHMVSVAQDFAPPDPFCLGADAASVDFNAIYEAGVAFFKSAGNNGHTDPTNCTLGGGSAAIGVFPVAAVLRYSKTSIPGGSPTITDGVDNVSSLGGTGSEGGGRTIVGLSAITGHDLRAEEDGSASPQYESQGAGHNATSGAVPSVTGAAALFRDWYLTKRGNLIDNPGILYANMLLMGDTSVELGANPVYDGMGFSNLMGAGRLRLRTYGASGIDGPGGYRTGEGCLDHYQTHYINVNNGDPLPAGVDYIKAVTWWYDHGHDDFAGASHDNYTLALQRDDGAGSWHTLLMDASQDNKQRVFFTGDGLSDGGDKFRIAIRGFFVTSDVEGCGTDSNRIHYALLWEDNARDDGGDNTLYIRPHPGVLP